MKKPISTKLFILSNFNLTFRNAMNQNFNPPAAGTALKTYSNPRRSFYPVACLFIGLFAFSGFGGVFAQDVLYKINGNNLIVNITDADEYRVKFTLYDDVDDTEYSIGTDKLVRILYADGTRVNFDNERVRDADVRIQTKSDGESSAVNSGAGGSEEMSMFAKGRRDGEIYYTQHVGAGTGTLFASLLSPLVGLIPAAATSSAMPKEMNLGYPDRELFKNSDYRAGYEQAAHQKKREKVWNNWWVGFGVNLAVLLLFVASGD